MFNVRKRTHPQNNHVHRYTHEQNVLLKFYAIKNDL